MLLFWTSCVLPHGFQIQSGYLACTLSCLHAVILKVTSGGTPAFSTNRGVHCISMYMAWRIACCTLVCMNSGLLLLLSQWTVPLKCGLFINKPTYLNLKTVFLIDCHYFKSKNLIERSERDLTNIGTQYGT